MKIFIPGIVPAFPLPKAMIQTAGECWINGIPQDDLNMALWGQQLGTVFPSKIITH
jgi:hypothetical protein